MNISSRIPSNPSWKINIGYIRQRIHQASRGMKWISTRQTVFSHQYAPLCGKCPVCWMSMSHFLRRSTLNCLNIIDLEVSKQFCWRKKFTHSSPQEHGESFMHPIFAPLTSVSNILPMFNYARAIAMLKAFIGKLYLHYLTSSILD